jgi:hypothetical protein
MIIKAQKNECKIKTLSGKQKLGEFTASRPMLQETLRAVSQAGECITRWNGNMWKIHKGHHLMQISSKSI